MSDSAIVVFTTVSNAAEADRLAREIIEAKLAACVQILPPMKSVYLWENAIQTETEILLLIKTLDGKYSELENFILERHSYEVPEIIAVSVEKISNGYFRWLADNLT